VSEFFSSVVGIQIQKSSISLKSPQFLLHYYNDLNPIIALSQQHISIQSYEHIQYSRSTIEYVYSIDYTNCIVDRRQTMYILSTTNYIVNRR